MVEQLSDEQIEELREVFDLYDNFKDGLVLKKNVGKIFNALGQNPSKEDIDKLIAEVQSNTKSPSNSSWKFKSHLFVHLLFLDELAIFQYHGGKIAYTF